MLNVMRIRLTQCDYCGEWGVCVFTPTGLDDVEAWCEECWEERPTNVES